MKPCLILSASVFFLTGCIPLRQGTLVAGPGWPTLLLCEDRYLLAGIDVNREKIMTGQSYVKAPTGTRYTLRAGPHPYDMELKSEALRADLYLYDDHGSQLQRWSNGVWSFHLEVETKGVIRTIDQQWKYWTFYYSPLVHGAPN